MRVWRTTSRILSGDRKLPRQVDTGKVDSAGASGLGRNVRGGTWPRLVMGALGVVGREPGLGDRAHLLERIEEIGVEHLFAVRPVEAFDEGVLIGLAGLNVTEADLLRGTPLDEGFGNELGAVVDAYPCRMAIEPHELVQHPNDPGAGDGGADLDGERLPIAFVDDREGSEGTAVVQGVDHEIECPGLVQARRGRERLPQARRDAALGPPRQVQAKRAIYAMHPLMVPAMPTAPEAIEAFPEPPAAVSGHDV